MLIKCNERPDFEVAVSLALFELGEILDANRNGRNVLCEQCLSEANGISLNRLEVYSEQFLRLPLANERERAVRHDDEYRRFPPG